MATRDPEGAQQRILAAALEEFSSHGYAGARVDVIAARAGVNKRMLYHYFGSKQRLFEEILRRRVTYDRSAAEVGVVSPLADPIAALEEAASDDIIRMLTWEALQSDPREPVEAEELRRERYREWIGRIEDAQRAGTLPANLDAAQLAFAQLALAIFPRAFPQLVRLVTGHDGADPGFRAAQRAFLQTLEERLVTPVVRP